jgi:glutathione S-transferase
LELVAIVTLLALVECLFFSLRSGLMRSQYNVEAPATVGHPVWERYYRVHQNTIEQLAVFLPALWICATYTRPDVAAGLGLVFVIGRAIYYVGYIADPGKRGTGFLIGYLAVVALVLGGLGGAIASAFA